MFVHLFHILLVIQSLRVRVQVDRLQDARADLGRQGQMLEGSQMQADTEGPAQAIGATSLRLCAVAGLPRPRRCDGEDSWRVIDGGAVCAIAEVSLMPLLVVGWFRFCDTAVRIGEGGRTKLTYRVTN